MNINQKKKKTPELENNPLVVDLISYPDTLKFRLEFPENTIAL